MHAPGVPLTRMVDRVRGRMHARRRCCSDAAMADSSKRPFAFTITSGGRTLLMAPDSDTSDGESDRATWVATLLAARRVLQA